MKFRSVFAILALILLLATPWRAGICHADEPTPTPMPIPTYQALPVDAMTTTINLTDFLAFTPTNPISATIDIGMWEYDNFVTIVRIARTFLGLGYTGYLIDIMFVVGIAIFVLPPILSLLRAYQAARNRKG